MNDAVRDCAIRVTSKKITVSMHFVRCSGTAGTPWASATKLEVASEAADVCGTAAHARPHSGCTGASPDSTSGLALQAQQVTDPGGATSLAALADSALLSPPSALSAEGATSVAHSAEDASAQHLQLTS